MNAAHDPADAFQAYLDATPLIRCEEAAQLPCAPTWEDGRRWEPAEIATLLEECGYQLVPDGQSRLAYMLPNPQGIPQQFGPVTNEQMATFVLKRGMVAPPDRPGLWAWYCKPNEQATRVPHVKLRYAQYEGSRLCFYWPDNRIGLQPVEELRYGRDGVPIGFNCKYGTWYCAPVPAAAFLGV